VLEQINGFFAWSREIEVCVIAHTMQGKFEYILFVGRVIY
jgi:hypothetical protein